MTTPDIYRLYNGAGAHTVLMAGTHGNESGPCSTLEHMVRHWDHVRRYLPAGRYTVVPTVNPDARRANTRTASGQPDINRSYPSGTAINRVMQQVFADADLVVDFHEAWSTATRDPTSLGASIYTNTARMRVRCDRACRALGANWQRLDELPVVRGAVDHYLDGIDVDYVLVEIPGQQDIRSCHERTQMTRTAIVHLLV